MRVKARVAYDGTGYSGFQWQSNAPTIQAELERALQHLIGTFTRIVAAGRTDAGVHAEGQIIAFDTEWRHPLPALMRGMNALLPTQIAVLEMTQAPDSFHPRFDARRRWYRYTIYHAPVRHPLAARVSLHVHRALDVPAMQQAASVLVGQHDFKSFGSPPQGENSVREVFRAEWTEGATWGAGRWLYFDIEANAFLRRMVRMIVGTLLRVGYGGLSPESVRDILEARDRQLAGPAVSPHGLSLRAVAYES